MPDAREALLPRAARLPILTVGEYPAFLNDGGIIGLRVIDGKVRFDVNLRQAERVGLRVSSQLLRLARIVRHDAP
jgi:hypothetical protein